MNKNVMEGNQMKMREALDAAIGVLEEILDSFERGEGGVPKFEVKEVIEKGYAALSAPVRRNCDRFGGDYKMLHTAWFDWTGSPSGHLPDGTAKMTFAAWLLAPAIERKGEGDAN